MITTIMDIITTMIKGSMLKSRLGITGLKVTKPRAMHRLILRAKEHLHLEVDQEVPTPLLTELRDPDP